jgi:hypothetical protein
VTLYDRIGRTYTSTRHADPRIAAAILDALGDARTVLNVGAGTGNYEPADRKVVALEPSPVMIAQRPAGAPIDLIPVAVSHDCNDGFYGAYWRRPEAYLHGDVRAGISVFSQVPSGAVDRAVVTLGADLETGRWHERHRELLTMDELHLGYYVITAESTSQDRRRT